ncbi:hypothetical protein ACQ4PT_016788 [Festuca glaucescens]
MDPTKMRSITRGSLTGGKHKLWDIVNKYFNIDPLCKDWVMRSAGKKWRDFKSTLKKVFFDPELSTEENIANGYKGKIPTSDWEALCDYWILESTKEKAQNNALNRANQKNACHTSGSRILLGLETEPAALTPVDDVLTLVLGTPPDAAGVVQTSPTDVADDVQTATVDAALVTLPTAHVLLHSVTPLAPSTTHKGAWKKAGEAAVSFVGGNSSKRKRSSEPQFVPLSQAKARQADEVVKSLSSTNRGTQVEKADGAPALNTKTTSTLGPGKRVHRRLN